MSTDFKRSPTLPGNLTLFLIFYSSQQFSYLISPKLLPSFSLSVLLTPPVWWPLSSSSNRWDSCYQRPSLQLNSVPQSPLPFLGFCPAINLFLLHHQFLPLSWTIPSAYKLALVYTVLKTKNFLYLTFHLQVPHTHPRVKSRIKRNPINRNFIKLRYTKEHINGPLNTFSSS